MIRFAFEGRCSTEDNQDPESSRAWQMNRAKALIEPHGGEIVAEYFDAGQSRALPWQRRPMANKLLQDLKDPRRGFEAVVIGEPQRAFYGNQFGLVFPLFSHYQVPLWVPEVGGPIDPDNEAHDLIMSVFGGMSKGERNRVKVRVRAAMAAQAKVEGRFLGGRPPYGYRLIDLGPHPNPSKAADGRQLHGLALDEVAVPVVVRIFVEFLRSRGIFAIAEGLTRDGIPSPSAHDPARNSHRSGKAWSKGAVRAILTNPRYTGRQVWNRQRKDEVLLDVEDVSLGHTTKLRWNSAETWIWSEEAVHPEIIDIETFTQAQQLLAGRGRGAGDQKTPRTRQPYALRGAVHCGVCDRKMQGHTVRGEAYYRCRYPQEYALANTIAHQANVYVREDVLVPALDRWLADTLRPPRLAETLDAMVAAQEGPSEDDRAVQRARQTIEEVNAKLTRYRAALDAGADPVVVTGWIAQAQAEKTAAERELREANKNDTGKLTREEISEIVESLGDIASALAEAEPAEKADLYRSLQLRLTYHPTTSTVRADMKIDTSYRGVMERVRGGT
ncbi:MULTISPECIES: recombinase family protein [Parafrankia]|uniref:recombinase family protein n=1 Tax=Parafrankia TaxID=2994362 RepID=UPI000A83D4D1|nr:MULTISPECIES: recombinase family protein [Parafrankia]MBE3200430.1 recombinase family protein [Parafrankia sp. CH37]